MLLLVATFGAAIKPDNETVRNRIQEINKQFGISNRYAPVFRRGGLYQFFSSRGVTWGRNLVVPYEETDTYIHEYMHYIQQVQTGFGTMQGKDIIEQLRATFSGYQYDPYMTPGTNEYDANKWTNYFLHR